MYFISLIANNVVLSAVTVLTIYLSYSIFGLCRRVYSQSTLNDLDDRVADINQRTACLQSKMEAIDQKLDLLLEGRD